MTPDLCPTRIPPDVPCDWLYPPWWVYWIAMVTVFVGIGVLMYLFRRWFWKRDD